jgi:acetyltransferase-like isoleucine patch superfamily enzyme
LYKTFSKINILGYILNRLIYKIKVGNYVNFSNQGEIIFSKNVAIRDFSEIIIEKNGLLTLKNKVFIGKNVEIGASDILIDDNTSIQNNCILLGNIKIGKNCLFAPNIYMSSGKHNFKYKAELLIHDQDLLAKKNSTNKNDFIIIEDDVWIGKNVMIINGAKIGKGAIIGANTFINKDVEPYTVVVGSPQKVLSHRLNFFLDLPSSLDTRLSISYPYLYSGIDYSLSCIEKNQYPKIVDNEFTLYLNNDMSLPLIIIELESTSDINIKHGNIINTVNVNTVKTSFKTVCTNNQYIFKLDNSSANIVIKKVYFAK